MTRLLQTTPILLIAALASAPPAFAQPKTFQGRGFIVVNGGYQITRNNFEKASTFNANAEDGSFTTDYEVKGGPTFDVAGGATLWRRLAVGVGVTRFSRSTPSTLNGSVPHPFSFDRLRSVTGDVGGLKREELIVHVQARATAPIGSRLQVVAFGGPSFFQVKQGMVSAFTWAESYPFDEASFGSATTVRAKGSKLGFNAGVDVAFFFSRQLGVGSTIQFSGTTVEIQSPGGVQEVKAGGARAGGGLRLRF
jgi:hypothetical protein